MLTGFGEPTTLQVAQIALNRTLKIPMKETKKRFAPERNETYFNADALWKRNFKAIDRSRDSYTKICRSKWRMLDRPKSKFVSESPI